MYCDRCCSFMVEKPLFTSSYWECAYCDAVNKPKVDCIPVAGWSSGDASGAVPAHRSAHSVAQYPQMDVVLNHKTVIISNLVPGVIYSWDLDVGDTIQAGNLTPYTAPTKGEYTFRVAGDPVDPRFQWLEIY